MFDQVPGDALRPAAPPAAAQVTSRASPPSLGRRILFLVGGLVLSFAALGVLGVWQAHEAARRQVAEQLLGTVRALARVVDFEFGRAEALLQGLALSSTLRAGDFDIFLAQARGIAEQLGLPALMVAGPDGAIRASTAPSLVQDGTVYPEAARSVAEGHTVLGDLDAPGATGRRRILLLVPVRAVPQGDPVLALGAIFPQERLRAALLGQRLPDGWVAAVLDRQFVVVARTRREEAVVGRLATQPVRQGLAAGNEGLIFNVVNQDGERSVVGYARAPDFGYAVVAAAPEAAFAAARRDALLRFGFVALPVAASAMLLAIALRRRLSSALRRLAAPGAAAEGPQLREVEELAGALARERAARDAVEAELRERSAWFEAAQEAARVGVWQQDLRAGRSHWSAGMRRILALPAEAGAAPLGSWLSFVHPDDRARVTAAAEAQLRPEGRPFAEEFRVIAADGTERWVRGQGAVERDAAGTPVRALGAWIDITKRRLLEEEREALLRHQEFLAGEIHHRVKNSLQLVLALLLLQARRAPAEATGALRDAARRVGTVAAVHRRLYEDQADGAGDVGRYLAGLVEDLRASLVEARGGRDLVLEAEPGLRLPPERLAPLGIVATELVTNALKYGRGRVTVRVLGRDDGLMLAVEDEGPGFPPGFDPNAARGLGMRVAQTLARQSGGRLDVDRAAAGGRVVLTLPLNS